METITTEAEVARAGFYWRESEGVRALVCEPLEQDGFVNGFSTRLGGVSPMPDAALSLAGFNEDKAENILENRRRFLKLFPGDWTLAGCWQVHGADVRVVKDREDAKPAENELGDTVYCDAILSDAAGVLAGVKTADCVPLLFGDPTTGAFAAVHAGWRGTLAEVARVAVNRMKDSYDVRPEDVIDAFTSKFPDGERLFRETRPGHALVDLLTANRDQLIVEGVLADRIHIAPLCTMCRTDLFFSYRKEKRLQGKVGRLMAVVGKSQ